jgi:ABC-type bacteriocin/lantibiotic exporter with double-glycine peptidase domain
MKARAAKVFSVLLLAAGISAAQSSSLWIDVPFVQQSREGCGAASLAMVMQYWQKQQGEPAAETSEAPYILKQLHSPEGHGIYASAMESYLKEHGYRTFAFPGKWADLQEHLLKGRPLIVALKPADWGKALHYVVVAGIDSDSDLVMFNDPAGRKLTKLDRKTFEKEWDAAGHWTLLALPQKAES